ncbi:MAG: DinB-like domain protein [Acidobacteria bacterium]|nr:DinB-like domain protein [Acidobacteriota bacterium]
MNRTEREALIDGLAAVPAALEAAITGLTDAQLDTPYREGGWTVRQVVHHLADSHINAFVRVKLVLTEDHPTLKPYVQDRWAELADTKLPVAPSLAIVRGVHERWVALLRSLPGTAWTRTAFHPENGEMSLDDILALYGRHGADHVGQIAALRARMAW